MEVRNKITTEDFFEMRKSVEWKNIGLEQLEIALKHTMITIGIYEGNKIVAMGRLVGDFTCKGMLTDIVVKPEYQKKGYGKIIITEILKQCKNYLKPGEKIQIEANPTNGNRNFYIKCGLKYKPENQDGVYIWLEKNNQ